MKNSSSKQTRRSFVELSTIGLMGTVMVGCSQPSDAAGETDTGNTGESDAGSNSSEDTKSASSSSNASGDVSNEESSDSSLESSDSQSSSESDSGDSSSDGESDSTEGDSTESDSGDSSSDGESDSTDGDSTDSSEDDGSDTDLVCDKVDRLTEGPFYQQLAERTNGNLDLYGDNGVKFELVGRVLDLDCKPVANASVGMWHASPSKKGETGPNNQARDATYDHPSDKADSNSSENNYYGRVKADADGNFRITSLRPGWYRNGNYYRPAHLHIKVFKGTTVLLTTQLFFDDDPALKNDGKNGQGNLFNSKNVLSVDPMGKTEFDLVVNV